MILNNQDPLYPKINFKNYIIIIRSNCEV